MICWKRVATCGLGTSTDMRLVTFVGVVLVALGGCGGTESPEPQGGASADVRRACGQYADAMRKASRITDDIQRAAGAYAEATRRLLATVDAEAKTDARLTPLARQVRDQYEVRRLILDLFSEGRYPEALQRIAVHDRTARRQQDALDRSVREAGIERCG